MPRSPTDLRIGRMRRLPGRSATRRGAEDRSRRRDEGLDLGDDSRGLEGLYLAMAYQKLGRPADARAVLTDALRASGVDVLRPLGPGWSDWLMCRIVAREAEAVVLYYPIFPADPFAR